MVIRGAHEYPGAVAVEDELGRVILLHKLPREVTAMLQQSVLPSSLLACYCDSVTHLGMHAAGTAAGRSGRCG